MKLRFSYFLACAVVALEINASADFTSTPIPELPGVQSSSVAWGDFDNDGLMDFLVTGTTNGSSSGAICQLWRNTGSTFTNIPISGLPGVTLGQVAWTDFDNDGRLDFILIGTINGSSTNTVSQLWRNTGNGFTNITSLAAPGLPSVDLGSVAWLDYDNDGKMDLIITGVSPTGLVAQVWRNLGGTFTNVTSTAAPGLPPVNLSVVVPADFNNDGWVDFILLGSSTELVAQLWQNVGGVFTNVTATLAPGMPGVFFGSAAWGDYDNDGLLDLLITGYQFSGNNVAQLWHNTGSGFANVPIPNLEGIRFGTGIWGDFDNNGQLDFLVTGYTPTSPTAQIWRNTGSSFTNANDTSLTPVYSASVGSAACADFDNDGRLDLLITGLSPTGAVTQLLRNSCPTTNTPPPTPSSLGANISNGVAFLSWSAPSDTQSATNLSYNIRVGTTPGASDIVNPQANVTNGFRRVPMLGNAQLRTTARLNLAPGVYYWSVQAVDSAFAGGSFATEASFEIPPTLNIAQLGANVRLSWQTSGSGWILQETDSLSPAAWSNSSSGTLNPATVQPTALRKFYRLYKP